MAHTDCPKRKNHLYKSRLRHKVALSHLYPFQVTKLSPLLSEFCFRQE